MEQNFVCVSDPEDLLSGTCLGKASYPVSKKKISTSEGDR